MLDNILPSLGQVQKMLQCLLGDGVQAKSTPTGPDLAKPYVLASYVNDAAEVRRVLACDLSLANSIGAAFSMIPANVAADSTKAGKVPENIHVNLYEVLNVCVNLFTDHGQERLTLSEMKVCKGGDVTPAISQSAKFNVQVPRYAGGICLAGKVG